MIMEKHNICLWNNGLNAESDLINFIKKDESLKLISINYYYVPLEEDQTKLCKAIYYKSETNFDNKVKRCGFKKFIKIEVELNCSKTNIETTRGISQVSKEIYELKTKLRNELNLLDLIHCTDTEKESKLLEIFLNKNFKKDNNKFIFTGIKKIEDVKDLLNNFFNYLILRNFESFYSNEKHGDVDILCESRIQIIRLL